MSPDRVGIVVNSAPPAEHVSYVAGALTELLTVGAQQRTSESVMHAALGVLRDACQSAPVHLSNACINTGDRHVNVEGK